MSTFEVNITDDDYTLDVSTSPAITVDVADEAVEVDVISGAQGVQGPQGPEGDAGPQGDAGADAEEIASYAVWYRAGFGDDLGPWTGTSTTDRPVNSIAGFPAHIQCDADNTDESAVLSTSDNVVARGTAGGHLGFTITCTFFTNDDMTLWLAPTGGNGTRVFIGATTETAGNCVGSDDPSGSRVGLSFVNVVAGRADTTFKITTKNGTTETLTDTTIAPLQNKLYRVILTVEPGGDVDWQLDNLTDDTTASGTVTATLPAAATSMAVRAGIRAVSVNDKNLRITGITVAGGFNASPGGGTPGPTGPAGQGVASGGSTGQVLTKTSGINYDTGWSTLTASDVGAAATSHAHAGTDITSGTVDIARLPTGTSGTTVALGNHLHTGVYDPAGTAATAVSTHESDTTSVHGIADTADLVLTSDARLSDARTPTAHTHGTADITSGTLDIARIPTGSSASTVCIGNDSRLSDARTPTSHNHAGSDITSGTVAFARLPTGSPLVSYGLITTTTSSDGTNWTSITGSPVSITNGQSYRIRWMLRSYSAATTTGLQVRRVFAASGAATIHGMHYVGMSSATAGILQSSREGTNDHFLGLGNATSSTSAAGSWIVEAVVTCTASGTLGLEMRTEVNTSLVTVDGDGSYWIAETWVQ